MKIVLTGFGPFGEHKENASWVAVRGVPEHWSKLYSDLADVIIEEIPVEYKYVQENVPYKWPEADFVVHVGVSSAANDITIEECAKNCGYTREDVTLCCPHEGVCVLGGEQTLTTCLDVNKLSLELNSAGSSASNSLSWSTSQDAGNYLCEFIYYSSLHANEGRSLFVHVPPLDKPFSGDQLSQALCELLVRIVKLNYQALRELLASKGKPTEQEKEKQIKD